MPFNVNTCDVSLLKTYELLVSSIIVVIATLLSSSLILIGVPFISILAGCFKILSLTNFDRHLS